MEGIEAHVISWFDHLRRLCKPVRVDDRVAGNLDKLEAAVQTEYGAGRLRALVLLPVNGVVLPFGLDLLLRKLSDLPTVDGKYSHHLHRLLDLSAVI